MIAGQMRGDLGFSLNPVKLVKSAAKGVVAVAKKTGGVARNSLVQDAVGIIPVVGTSAQSALKTYGSATALIPGKGGGPKAPVAAQTPGSGDGSVNLAPAQDAAAAAPVAPAPVSAAMVNLPGIGAVPKKTAIIGGAVVGGLLLVLLLRK